jgi:Flp pilus assembly protein TadD/4-amino-4-deoxy-L-arabinose transferase-like glycosyltransferase
MLTQISSYLHLSQDSSFTLAGRNIKEPQLSNNEVGAEVETRVQQKRRLIPVIVAVIFLLVFTLMCLDNIWKYSPTFDEMKFLQIGKELASGKGWQTEMSVVHAPLSFYTHGFLLKPFHFQNELQRLRWARVTMLIYPLALGLLIFVWAASLFSPEAGIIALTLFVFNSNILGHSSLITTDIIYACFSIFLLFCFWKYLAGGGARWILASGVMLGLALLSKYSAVLWFFLLPALGLVVFIQQHKEKRDNSESLPLKFLPLTIAIVIIFFIALIILNLGYGFTGSFFSLGSHNYQSHLLARLSSSPLTSRVPFPAPYPFIRGYDAQKFVSEVGHPSFLMGTRSTAGWWYYYPLAFFLKMPALFWPLMILAVAAVVRKTSRAQKDSIVFLLAASIAIALLQSILSRSQAGFRYLIVTLPPLFIIAGAVWNFCSSRYKKILLLFPVALYVAPALWIHPHHLAYFSELIGGPRNGYKWLSDSNLDWGQDYAGALHYMRQSNVPLTMNPGIMPVPGRILINATTLQDCFSLYDIHGWLREFEPVDNIGYSWLIYEVDEKQVNERPIEKRRLPDDYFFAAFAYARNNFSEAEKKAKNALQLQPQLAEARYLLGLSLMGEGKLEEAAEAFALVPQLHPLYIEARSNLSFLAALKGDIELSHQYQKQSAVAETANAYVKKPNFMDKAFAASFQNDNSYKAHNNLGVIQWASGNLQEAEREIRTVIQLEPNFAEALANLANILEERGAFAEAVELSNRYYQEFLLLKCSPYRDYRVYYENNKIMFGDTFEIFPKPDSDILRLKLHLSLYPDDHAVLNQLSVSLMKAGRFGEAYSWLERGISGGKEGADALYTNLAVLYTEKRMFPNAVSACRQALNLDPKNSSAAGLLSAFNGMTSPSDPAGKVSASEH